MKQKGQERSLKSDDAIFNDWRFEIINTTTTLPSDDDNLPLEWKFNTSETEYLDPRMFLKLEVKITKANGTAIVDDIRVENDPTKPPVGTEGQEGYKPQGKKQIRTTTNVGPINFLLMTMFKQVDFQVCSMQLL